MRKTVLLITALLVVAGYAAPLAAQSLADVARKEEERRKEIKTPAKVLTNKDLADVPPATAPPPASTSADKPADAAATGDKAEPKDEKSGGGEGTKDQKYWSTKMKTLQDTLSHDQVLADAMQTQVSSLTTDFVNRDDPAQRAVIERNRQTALSELNRLKDQIKKDQKALDDLQEEARRAGVPPGWLR